MFPVEFAGIVSLPTGDTMPIEAPFLGSGDILATDMVTGTNLSGEILSGIVVTTGTTEQAATTGQHGSADETMFTDLQDL